MRRTRSIDSESPAGDGAFAARQRLPSTRIKANRDGEFIRTILACASEIASVDPGELVQSEMNQMEPAELLGRLDSFAGWKFPALRRSSTGAALTLQTCRRQAFGEEILVSSYRSPGVASTFVVNSMSSPSEPANTSIVSTV